MALAFLAACKFDEITVAKTVPSVVVHLVMNPATAQQVMLLERTLTGALTVNDSAFDPNNPISSAGGIPVSGAVADIIDSTGRAVRAIEDRLIATGAGTGVYRFQFAQSPRLGALYQLRIHTAEGEDVTASTRIPAPGSASTGALTRVFNRDRDTLPIRWAAAPGARAYAVRIESPFGPFFLFTDTTAVVLPGTARNLFANNLERLFIPGFRQDVFIGAVDSNFYDYYRTENDPFTGSGIINRVKGGIGLFGSIVTLTTGTLTVVADQTDPIEGRFRASPTPTDQVLPATLNLYVESKSTRSDVPDALSGRYTTSGNTTRSDGILGQQSGSNVTLVILVNQLSGDTLDVFDGVLNGGTLTGSYRRRGATAVFVKQ